MQNKVSRSIARSVLIAVAGTGALIAGVVFAAAPTFTTQSYTTGGHPAAVAIGDVNGDSKNDLVVGDTGQYSGNTTVSVLLGNGNGTFQARVPYTVGTSPFSVVLGYFNADTNLDIATANSDSNTVSILLGNGDGTFQPQVTYTTGAYPLKIAVEDFNGDGKSDLAVTNLYSSSVSIFLGNGDGTFQPQVTYATDAGSYGITTGYFDVGSTLDLAVTNAFGASISVLLGNGDGTFQPQVTYASQSGPQGIAVADVNGDSKADLAIANGGSDTVSVLLGNGDGTFQPQVTYSSTRPFWLAIGDIDGDTNPDIVVSNTDDTNGTVSVLLGNGDGTFQTGVGFPAGLSPTDLALGYLNGDTKLDVATADYNRNSVGGQDVVSVLLNTTVATPSVTALAPAKVWVGLKNSDDVGTKFDLKAEVYVNGNLVGSGQINSAPGGSSGFNNAKLNTIPLTIVGPTEAPPGATLSTKVYVRNTCFGPTHNSGTARLWYNGADANSQFGVTIDTSPSTNYLRDVFALNTSAGSAKKSIDVAAGAPCSAFKLFGTWSRILP